MNNSVYGKIEQLRNRVDLRLSTNARDYQKLVCKPNFERKLAYCGMYILKLSNNLMYDLNCIYIKEKYCRKAKLLFKNTESLKYTIETNDVYEDFYMNNDMFDFSEYPDNPIFDVMKNKKVIGKMKDETKSTPFIGFALLKSKIY